MAHEIATNDGLMLADRKGWHGLGTVVQGAPNPYAALRIAKLEWDVLESDSLTGLYGAGTNKERRIVTGEHKMLVRSDDHTMLAVVGSDYQPVQNSTLADLAYAFRAAGSEQGVQVESAGSIRGGKRVFMLLRGPSVDMTGMGDEAHPYLLLANGHDGTLALRVQPTSVRVVCRNTFHAALRAKQGWSFRHTLNIGDKVDSLAADIKRWFRAVSDGQGVARDLAAKQVNREMVRNLWSDVLLRIDGPVPAEVRNKWDENRREKATAFLAHAAQVFDRESRDYGANLWVAANAATNAIQHLRAGWSVRTKETDARAYAAWDGTTATATQEAFDAALALL